MISDKRFTNVCSQFDVGILRLAIMANQGALAVPRKGSIYSSQVPLFELC